jgi:hypothetical protein
LKNSFSLFLRICDNICCPAQEDIEKTALAVRANDQEVNPKRFGGGDDQLARILHLL